MNDQAMGDRLIRLSNRRDDDHDLDWLLQQHEIAGKLLLEQRESIAELEKRNDALLMDGARLRAANRVHMQTLAIITRWNLQDAPEDTAHEFAKERMNMADKAAASVRREDLVKVTLNNQESDDGK